MRLGGPDWSLEAQSPAPVCGVDEAGRGPWAGPVTAAAVILDPNAIPDGLNDSKKLSEKARDRLEVEIMASALAWGVGEASPEEICQLNIVQATGLAMRRAMAQLAISPVFALVDGNYAFDLACPVRTVIKGDGLSLSIAAASILAKVARDRVMYQLDGVHPGYGFAAHKGYGVPAHAAALRQLGPCAAHRLTWGPILALHT
jgi:ribonuclease HII